MRTAPMPLLALLLLVPAVSRGETSPDYVPEARSSFETFTSKVLKTYSFTEGEISYTAYVVTWKGHEVVVVPSGGRSEKKFEVGETIRCAMHQSTRQRNDKDISRIEFSLAPGAGAEHTLMPVDVAGEQARLEAIAVEVERRRAIRQAALKAGSGNRSENDEEKPAPPKP